MFAFSGYHQLNLQRLNLVAVAAHLPWIALGVHGLFDAGAAAAPPRSPRSRARSGPPCCSDIRTCSPWDCSLPAVMP